MIALVKQILHEEPYSKLDILAELETNLENLEQVSLTPNTKHIQDFKLHQRALHVFEGKNIYMLLLNEIINSLILPLESIFNQLLDTQ